MRPALVWGWTRDRSRSRATISERTVAEETCTPGAVATCEEPTGSAVPMYSVTTASKMAARRALRPSLDLDSRGGAGSAEGVMAGLALHSTECQPTRPGTHAAGSVVAQAQGRDEGLLG